MNGYLRLLLSVCMLVALSPEVHGADRDSVTASPGEVALLGGYGITHRGFGATRTQVQTVDFVLRYGHFLTGILGEGAWYEGRHEIIGELPSALAPDQAGRSMVGFNILGSWKFTRFGELVPYLFVGGGLVYVDLGLPTMATRLNGNYQAGGGIQHFIARNLAIQGEYRYHHISNADTASPNEPLNSSKFLIGISYFR